MNKPAHPIAIYIDDDDDGDEKMNGSKTEKKAIKTEKKREKTKPGKCMRW